MQANFHVSKTRCIRVSNLELFPLHLEVDSRDCATTSSPYKGWSYPCRLRQTLKPTCLPDTLASSPLSFGDSCLCLLYYFVVPKLVPLVHLALGLVESNIKIVSVGFNIFWVLSFLWFCSKPRPPFSGSITLAFGMDNKVLAEMFTKKRGKLQKDKANELTKEVALNAQTKRKVAARKSRADDSTSKPNKPAASVRSKIAEEAAEMDPSKAKNKAKYSVPKRKSGGSVHTIEGEEEAPEATILENNNGNMKTSKKKKRGADDEIAQACLSYANGTVTKLRVRKEVPAFRLVELAKDDDSKIVGKQVQVYWPDSKRWFTGRIMAFERRKKLHSILYKDGDKEELDLRKERFLLGVLPSEDFKLKVESKSRKKIEVVDGTSIGADAMKKDPLHVSDADNVTGISVTQYKRGSKKVANQMSSVLKRRDPALEKGEQVVPDAGVDELPENTKKGPSRPLKMHGRSKGKATFSAVKRRKLELANRKASQKKEQQDAQVEVHAQHGANINSVQGGINANEASEDDLLKGSKKTEAPTVTARKVEEQMKRGETDGIMLDCASFRKNDNEMDSTRSREVSSDLQTAALECPAGTLGVEHGKVNVGRGECKRDRETLTFVRRKRC